MHQRTELQQTLPHLLVALSEESKMKPRGDKGSEMSLLLLIFHPGTLTLEPSVSKQSEFNVGQGCSPIPTAWVELTMVTCHHVLVQGPVVCG